jgi:hypothetical protein
MVSPSSKGCADGVPPRSSSYRPDTKSGRRYARSTPARTTMSPSLPGWMTPRRVHAAVRRTITDLTSDIDSTPTRMTRTTCEWTSATGSTLRSRSSVELTGDVGGRSIDVMRRGGRETRHRGLILTAAVSCAVAGVSVDVDAPKQSGEHEFGSGSRDIGRSGRSRHCNIEAQSGFDVSA